ncbi:MAG: hypothetical protein GC156_07970 [Actinomycetales bacterium]|nr:hypothetical protein [Actinomycetales bacterium]
MSMEVAFSIIFGIAAVLVVSVLGAALADGRVKPERLWPWVLAAIVMVAGALLNIAVTIGGLFTSTGEIRWMVPADVALLAATALVFVRPRWAAWTLGISAVVVPALVYLATLIVADPTMGQDMLPVMVIFYSVRALIAAGLLWLATLPARGARPPASPSQEPRSVSAPTG